MNDKDAKTPPEQRPPGEPKQSGRVAYDSKGNPIWEWETSTGVYDRDVSTQRLKKLEAALSLEETQSVSQPKGLSIEEPERLPGGGINPYDTGGASDDKAAVAHPALAHKQPARQKPVRKSLVSKYAATHKPVPESKVQSLWNKLMARLKSS